MLSEYFIAQNGEKICKHCEPERFKDVKKNNLPTIVRPSLGEDKV